MRKRATYKKKPKIICFEGINRVGKNTVFQILKRIIENSKKKFYPERLSNKPLFPFGSKNKQIAFRSEIHFIQQMMERNKIIENDIRKNKIKICFLDRSAISVLVYSRALDLESKDFRVLDDLFSSVNWLENVMIYMEASPETLLGRIERRGTLVPERLKWNEDDLRYIKELEKYYRVYLVKCEKKMKIIRINTDNLNAQQVVDIIRVKLENLLPKSIPPPGQKLLDIWSKK